MTKYRENHPQPEDDEMIFQKTRVKKSWMSPEYGQAQERKRKQRKANMQRRKANIRLKDRIRHQDDQFIRSWTPEQTITN